MAWVGGGSGHGSGMVGGGLENGSGARIRFVCVFFRLINYVHFGIADTASALEPDDRKRGRLRGGRWLIRRRWTTACCAERGLHPRRVVVQGDVSNDAGSFDRGVRDVGLDNLRRFSRGFFATVIGGRRTMFYH